MKKQSMAYIFGHVYSKAQQRMQQNTQQKTGCEDAADIIYWLLLYGIRES